MVKKITLALWLWTASVLALAQSMEFAVSEWPPFEYSVPGGEARGYHPDIVRATLKSMGIESKFSFYPWPRCELLVQHKSVQGLLSLSPSKEREDYVIFPKENLSVSENVLFVLKDKEFNATSLAALAGKTIGTTAGYNYGDDFNAAVTKKLFETDIGKTDEQGFKKLQAGRFDAFVCDKVVGITLLKSLGLRDKVSILPLVISSKKMYVGFSKTPENAIFADKFDVALRSLKKSGEWQKIIDTYLK